MKQGFDVRNVSYEHIHSIKPEDFKALIDAIDPKPEETILDAMCGYGAVGKGILEREPNVSLYFLDESSVQLDRARENIKEITEDRFVLAEFPSHNFTPGFFDKIVLKMGLHEVSREKQILVVREINKILKPNGKFIVWDIMLNESTQTLFQDIIRKKDELSGFDMLAHERYFFTEQEFIETMTRSGFSKIKDFHTISYRFQSRKRLESELQNDLKKLEAFNSYVRERFPDALKATANYEDEGENISFNITKKIFVIEK